MLDSPAPEPTGLSTWVDWFAIIGVCVTFLLGIVNFWTQHLQTTPRLHIKPTLGMRLGQRIEGQWDIIEHECPLLHLTNVGRLPVFVSQVGFEGGEDGGVTLIGAEPVDGLPWTGVVEPGRTRKLRVPLGSALDAVHGRGRKRFAVFSETGKRFRSSVRDFRAFEKKLEESERSRAVTS